jgi:hypothetical protein
VDSGRHFLEIAVFGRLLASPPVVGKTTEEGGKLSLSPAGDGRLRFSAAFFRSFLKRLKL